MAELEALRDRTGHPVVDEQPALGHPQRRRARADLRDLERHLRPGDRSGVPKRRQSREIAAGRLGVDVRDPDRRTAVVDPGRGRGALARAQPVQVPHRPVQHRKARAAVGTGNDLGEEDEVLVGEEVQVGGQVRLIRKVQWAQPAPADRVRGDGQRGPRAERTVGDVGHHVHAEVGNEGDTGVLHAGIVCTPLEALLRGEHHALAFDADRYAVLDHDTGAADPGDVAGRDHAGEEVQLAVGSPGGGRIEDALGLQGVGGVGVHEHADPVQGIRERGFGVALGHT